MDAIKVFQNLNIKIVNDPSEATHFDDENKENAGKWIALDLDSAVIVKNGTQAGRSTVDLILKDKNGQLYFSCKTGRIMRLLAEMIGDENNKELLSDK